MQTITPFSPCVTKVLPANDANYSDRLWPHKIHTLHDIECPPGKGWVVALLGTGYMGGASAGVSIQLMADAGDTGQGAPLGLQCWHVGGPGNQLASGTEQAGYASFSTAMWLGQAATDGSVYYTRPDGTRVAWTAQNNADMRAQFERVATIFAELNRTQGIPLRWLTDAEMHQAHDDYEAGRPAAVSGFCRHQDWTRTGTSATSHHDPGDAYPKDTLMARAIEIRNPTPTPTPPPEDDDVVTPQDKQDIINGVIAALRDMDFVASDAYDAEAAKRAGKPYTAKTLKFVKFFETQYNHNSMATRDVFALRYFQDASASIVKGVAALFTDTGAGSVLDRMRNAFWDTKISAEKPSIISFGEVLRRSWHNTVSILGKDAAPAPQPDPGDEGTPPDATN